MRPTRLIRPICWICSARSTPAASIRSGRLEIFEEAGSAHYARSAELRYSWLPDAHTEAPTAGSVILAGVLLKTGAYGLLRFVLPLFPPSAALFAPLAMLLGAIGILYGAVLAFAQDDMKRLVAYSSVSHMGFVLLGIFAGTALALQGVVVEMIAQRHAGPDEYRCSAQDLRVAVNDQCVLCRRDFS